MAKILFVEDQPDTSDLVRMVLSMAGHQVTIAESGETALKQATEILPELILMDLSLPGSLDGYAVHKLLREDADFNQTPIIALTAHVVAQDRERIEAAGFDGYISKPIEDLEKFTNQISDCLSNRGMPTQASSIH